ncbi:MAG: NAD(P)H-dependent oxidoreductase [Cyclobacteriaceae bacterium]
MADSDHVVISTPEYIFSIPSGLKNILEWCVATTAFVDKPVTIITASAHGQKGHEELQLILQTLQAKVCKHRCLLIKGVKGKFSDEGNLVDQLTIQRLRTLVDDLLSVKN